MRKLITILTVFLLIFGAVSLAIEKTHPIVIKWALGEAKIIGRPIKVSVYTDGHLNTDIRVYRDSLLWSDGKFTGYLLSLKEYDKFGMLRYINIDPVDTLIGRPIGSSEADYELINGFMFQSETGSHIINFRDDIKGYNFDPHLEFDDEEIKFNVPPNQLKFQTIRIELNKK